MTPLISIIIPTYNSEKYLKECFDSVIAQTYKNIEVIIIDGGSLDKTKEISDLYCSSRSNWHFIETTKGVAHQRNVGLDTFKGDYLYFLDSDDYIDKDLISELYKTLITCDLDLVTPTIYHAYYDEFTLIRIKKIEAKIINNVDSENFFSEAYNSLLAGPTKLYKKELVEGVRHNESLSNGEDLLYNYQIVKKRSIKYGMSDKAIYYYRHDVKLINFADKRMDKSGFLFCNEMVDIIKPMDRLSKNYSGAMEILNIQLLHYIKAFVQQKKRIPVILNKSRKFLYKETNNHFKYYYLFPRLYIFLERIYSRLRNKHY